MAELQLGKILVTTDLSKASEAAFEAIKPLADGFDSKVTVLHVVAEPGWAPATSASSDPYGAKQRLKDSIQGPLDEMHGRLLGASARARTAIVDGHPVWKAICDYAHDHGYDLIAIATRGRSNVDGALIGSVAEGVARHAHCPVMCVRPSPA